MPPRMQQRWGPVDLTLSKPLGLVLEEFGGGGTAGVVVVSLVEGGAAEESGDVLPGDRLSRVDGADVSKLDFDAVMEALVAAPETLTLRLSRKLPARGDDNAPLDIVANLANQLAGDGGDMNSDGGGRGGAPLLVYPYSSMTATCLLSA